MIANSLFANYFSEISYFQSVSTFLTGNHCYSTKSLVLVRAALSFVSKPHQNYINWYQHNTIIAKTYLNCLIIAQLPCI